MVEYDVRPLVDNHLQVSECYPDIFSYELPTAVPSLASRTTTIPFDLVCCHETPDRDRRHFRTCLEPTSFFTTGQALHRRYMSHIQYVTAHLSFLEQISINVSCSNMRCAMALQTTDEPWTDIPKLSRVRLLRNSYDHTLSRDETERLKKYKLRNVNPSKSPDFFERRDTMATWTFATGWEADAKVTEECRKEESDFMIDRPYLWF